METQDYISPAGKLEEELLEIQKLDSCKEVNDMISISKECSGFFSIICC